VKISEQQKIMHTVNRSIKGGFQVHAQRTWHPERFLAELLQEFLAEVTVEIFWSTS
jgi:hypothetical protein